MRLFDVLGSPKSEFLSKKVPINALSKKEGSMRSLQYVLWGKPGNFDDCIDHVKDQLKYL
jgi:hypothetical protein